MTEYERMVAGLIYNPGDEEIVKEQIVGAGSVVTKDIPDNVVAVGNPCRVLREVGEHDREFFYKDERIDWETSERCKEDDLWPRFRCFIY